jgi:DNA-binding GntR family transcriptional regulator
MSPGGTTSAIRVHRDLRHAILEGELAPGERLRAEALAARLGTSRTPVREALLMLEREGLVDLQPNRGAIVRAFDAADLLDLYEVRALVEPHGAARAATRISEPDLARLAELCRLGERAGPDVAAQIEGNEEFHRIIAAAADSPRLLSALRGVAGIPRAFRAVFWATDEQREKSLFCHRELVAALAGRRPELAESVMRMHIVDAREFLRTVIHDRD